MKKINRTTLFTILIFFGWANNNLQAQNPNCNYSIEYSFDNLEINDYDTVWSIKCYINVTDFSSLKKMHLNVKDALSSSNLIINSSSPIVDSLPILTGYNSINAVSGQKHNETGFIPTYYKEGTKIVIDLGFNRNNNIIIDLMVEDKNGNKYKVNKNN